MTGILSGLVLWVMGALSVLAFGHRSRLCGRISAGTLLTGAFLMAPGILAVLTGADPLLLTRSWSVPGGAFALEIDALAAWFLIPTLGLSVLAAIYGAGYLSKETQHPATGPSWFFFNLLAASMAVVLMARNAVLFLTAWEVMALASFFLVTFHDERESVRRAGWIYLVAMHLGTVFLVAFFLIAGRETGSLDFRDWAAVGFASPRLLNLMFLLALAGFGAKAGIVPFHVWLPEAHPAAPSHVSAVMSGVMIKTGIYGLLRALTFLGEPPAWWGWTLLLLGVASGLLGVLFALAQHDLKRLLAYHSVENIGIIVMGLGLGVLGRSLDLPWLSVLGFAGCLLHVFNHALFKGLLFLGAGSVLKATGSLEIDRLGGLAKRMPWTGTLFLVGSAAICGLPPLNGFMSEMLVFLAALGAVGDGGTSAVLAGSLAITGLALISGLAIACFTKAFGIVFLGEPRTRVAQEAQENAAGLRIPMLILASGCLVMGVGAPLVVTKLGVVLAAVTHLPASTVAGPIGTTGGYLAKAIWVWAVLTFLCILLAMYRKWLLTGRAVSTSVTWDCGYARPTVRMQYTASSFARPITALFDGVLRTETHLNLAPGVFPDRADFATETPDPFLKSFYGRLFKVGAGSISGLRWLQHGNVHLYVLYIALTLLGLLFWMID
jgi:hydrogenase-4 component B